MKKYLAAAVLVVLTGAATAQAGVGVSVNIGIPVQMAPVPATVVAYPGYATAYSDAPGFIYSPSLGFHVSVGLPYDVVYIDNCYYQHRGGRWYMSPSYGGAWSYVSYRSLPRQLHRHRYEEIRHYRDTEYRSYQRDRDHYRGTWYRPAAMHSHDRWDSRVIDRRHDNRDNRRNDRWDHKRDRDRDRDGDPKEVSFARSADTPHPLRNRFWK